MSELTSQTVVKEMRAPVLIVGGGACGLSLSIFLSSHGVEHLLVERHPTTSHLPKAHYLNQRTMEVFRQHGLADELYAVGTPMQNMRKVRWRTTLGGDGPLDAKTFHEMDAFGGGALAETYARDSACPSSNYPQLRLEPLLRRRAQASPLATILFGHELTAISQTDSGIRATAVGLDDGTTLQITADFAVAADGGKRVGPLLGNGMSGISGLGRIVTSHIKADLSAWWDENCLITWFINPESSGALGSGAMVPMGPTWGSGSEEWVVHFGFPPGQEDLLDEEGVLPHLRELLNLPDLDIEVLKVSHWELEAVVAERYQIGNVFFAGDAAHRHPPTTGLGLNTAVQDAHNLAWKLGAVLNGRAGRALLDTYESERQPVGQRNVDWAMFTALNHQVLDAGMGFSPLQSAAQRRANFEAYFADTPMGASRRARAAEVINTQRREFQAHDLELGFAYSAGALVPDDSPAPVSDPTGLHYEAVARPGHRLPHVWLTRGDRRLSTHDLCGSGGSFLLLSGGHSDWGHAANQVSAALGVPIRHVAIGHEADHQEGDAAWARLSGVDADGAVLVRPDNHVAWRSPKAPGSLQSALESAMRDILARH